MERDGLCIWYKRLESGTFQLPARPADAVELDARTVDAAGRDRSDQRPPAQGKRSGLSRMKAELDELSQHALPRSSLGKAVTYALNQWQAFGRYIEDGRRTIDNNISERTLRAQALGRKNVSFR